MLALRAELRWLGLTLEPLGDGYWRVAHATYPLLVAFLDPVSDAEHDDLIGCFGHRKIRTERAASWLITAGGLPLETAMAKIPGYSELEFAQRLTSSRKMRQNLLRTMPAKDRVAGLSAEQRLDGLKTDELVRAAAKLPARARRALSEALKDSRSSR